jgi:hypothetical protein
MYAVVDIDSLWLRGYVPNLVCGKLAVCHNWSTLQRCCLVHHVRILYQFCIVINLSHSFWLTQIPLYFQVCLM